MAATLVAEEARRRTDAQSRRLEELFDEVRREILQVRDHGYAVERRVDANERELLRALGALHVAVAGTTGRTLADLDAPTAAFLNWSGGPEGFAAQAGLWFNPPVPVEHDAGRVAPLLVNERLVEQPFAFSALAGLREGGLEILDVGGAESTVALSLAALGHRVCVVDPRGYPLEHPRLRVRSVALEELEPSDRGFGAALALSAVEHFGLGAYGDPKRGARADLDALAAIRERLVERGTLVLTVPLAARASVDDFQRVYDPDGVRALLEGWEVRELRAAWQADRLTWVAGDLDEPAGDRGVALAVAVRSG